MNITKYRKKKGFSQEQLAKKCGMSQSNLASLENGDNQGSHISTLAIVADNLGIEIDALIEDYYIKKSDNDRLSDELKTLINLLSTDKLMHFLKILQLLKQYNKVGIENFEK